MRFDRRAGSGSIRWCWLACLLLGVSCGGGGGGAPAVSFSFASAGAALAEDAAALDVGRSSCTRLFRP